MQTQKQDSVHVKVSCNNEFRRFVLTEVTYSNLEGLIRTLLGFTPETHFKLSYLDDENDWVYFTTDSELTYAVTLTKSPLKISVKLSTPKQATVDTDEVAEEGEKPWRRCRGGRGGMRGGRGCGGKGLNMAAKKERIDAKISRLEQRHAFLTAALIENVNEEKARSLEWRLSHLQNKIDTIKLRKEELFGQATTAVQNETPAPVQNTADATTNEYETPKEEGPETLVTPTVDSDGFSCRGRRGGRGGRGGRGCWKREQGEDDCQDDHPREKFGAIAYACNTPEGKAAFERLQAAKEAVVTARRDKAGKEVVLEKIEELKEAKANWREVKMALWKERRTAK